MCADVNQLHADDSKAGLRKTPTKDERAKINLQSPQIWEHKRPADSEFGQSRLWGAASAENLTVWFVKYLGCPSTPGSSFSTDFENL